MIDPLDQRQAYTIRLLETILTDFSGPIDSGIDVVLYAIEVERGTLLVQPSMITRDMQRSLDTFRYVCAP